MPERSLRIAWLGAGPTPRETGGAPGVATEVLVGLAELGHQIDCFLPGTGHKLLDRIAAQDNLTFIWGTSEMRWSRWYNRTKIGAFVSSLVSRGLASVRLRREVARRHAERPYDVIYQFSSIESLSMPSGLKPDVPLAIHPGTHIAGELKYLIAERKLSLRCEPAYTFAIAAATMAARTVVQRVMIKRAQLLICMSTVFRDHLVKDYAFPVARTVVVPHPIRIARFEDVDVTRAVGDPPTVLVLGRVSARKGIEDVVAVAHELLGRGAELRIRVVGGPTLWSDYSKLLEDLPPEIAEFAGRVPPSEVPGELAKADLLLQASKYEPFGLTVAEALCSGAPVVATGEVGAIEGVSRRAVTEFEPGDVKGMADAVEAALAALRADTSGVRGEARAEAERLFSPDIVCRRIAAELERLADEHRAN